MKFCTTIAENATIQIVMLCAFAERIAVNESRTDVRQLLIARI